MSNVQGTTRDQTTFLRAFNKHPAGPPADLWPSPAVLRKWLRRESFRAALTSVHHALQFQADFHLATAAAQAAQRLQRDAAGLSADDVKKLGELLRLAHLRQRFPITAKLDSPATFRRRQEIDELEEFVQGLSERTRGRNGAAAADDPDSDSSTAAPGDRKAARNREEQRERDDYHREAK